MPEPGIDLIRRAQQRDPHALAALVEGQQMYVYSLALSLMKQPADAADLTQEVFARLFRVLPSYRGETRFTTWLYRLVVNLGIDELRKRGRTVVSLDSDDRAEPAEPPDRSAWADPVLAATRGETAARVERAVAQLPLAQRVALTMYFFEDFGYEEIAEAMGLPLNTVKSHLRRGKQRLAELLRDEAPVHGATADGSPPPRGPARGQANADSAGRPRIRPFSGMEARFRAMR